MKYYNKKFGRVGNLVINLCKLVVMSIFIVWVLYANVVYRLANPELTNTQVGIHFFTVGIVDYSKLKAK